jgi:S1-C subfamily serine protease
MGMLGLHYKSGWGVPKSNVRAYMWYTLGIRYGSKSSRRARARLVERMSRQQVSTATILAKYWKPKSDGLIKISQQLLSRLGYDVGVANGRQGGRTRLAIVSYQKNRGLAVTGRVSARLIKLMLADIGGGVPATAFVAGTGRTTPRVNLPGRTERFATRRRQRPARNRFDNNRRRARPRISTGTGFVVSKAGHILTNRHVVNRCKSVKIRWSDGDEGAARILSISKNADLALLKTSSKIQRVAKFRSGKRLRQGEDIAVYGFPLTGILSASGNLTTGSVAALAGLRDNASLMQISAPVQPGNSGGPVFDTFGRIVGVVVSKLNAVKIAKALKDIPQNINFAIKGSVATNFLEARGVSYEVEPGGVKRSNADNTEIAKAYTVRIECRH